MQTGNTIGDHSIDWAEHWRALVEDREAQAQRIRQRTGLVRDSYWDERAEGFQRATQRYAGEPDRLLELISAHLTPESSVLDVGAGVGRYALPLARLARQVIAVEPSEGMRGLMEANAAEQGIGNLTVVPARWEDAEVEPCDVALCSHVVYTVPDIRGFLEKLQRHTKGHCFMAIRTTQRGAHLQGLWKRVHGEERIPEPSLMDLYNVLYQCLGVCANVEVIPFRVGRSPLAAFDSLEDAVARVGSQLYLAEGAPQEALVREHLEAHLVPREGRLVLPGPSVGAAIVWWDNRPGSWNLMPRALPEG